jgi:P4 family phage/plasmid primase-like protien
MPTIPKALIEALGPFGLKRFIRVEPNNKRAIDKSWPDTPLDATDPALESWTHNNGNYGVMAGNGLVIVDLDDPTYVSKLPATFTVESGRGGAHLYYLSDIGDNATIMLGEKNIGNIQAKRKFVVGPGSLHKNGNYYHVKENRPLATITKEQLDAIFRENIKWVGSEIQKYVPQANEESDFINAQICDVVPTSQLRRHGDELQGSHPIHGSETGQNFCINARLNVWHCFRHNTGGGPLYYIAMAEGLLDCSECKPKALTGAKFMEAVKIAEEKYHIKVKLTGKTACAFLGKYFKVDERGRTAFLPVVFAKDLMLNNTFKTTRDNQTVFVYNTETNIYQPFGETVIQEEMTKILDENTKAHYFVDVLFFIKGSTYFDRPRCLPNKIVLNNGILDMETLALEPFNTKDFLLIHVPVTYDKTAGCPLIEQFIKEVVGPEQLPIIQEWLGYQLYLGLPFHKSIILLGGGDNGKSTLINLIGRFLGKENMSSVTLQALCSNRFAQANLYSKLANLCADLPDRALGHTGMFKMLVGGDMVPAERKFKDPFEFENTCKLTFSANKIPQTTDDTIAYFRRWIIIFCQNYFPPEKANPKILDYICTPQEFSGLLNWALDGLKRLMENGQFSLSRTWEQERERYLASSNSAQAFIEKAIEYSDEGESIAKEDLYEAYVKYCKQNGLPTLRQAELTQNLKLVIPEVKESRLRIGKNRTYAWKNIRFVSGLGGPGLLFKSAQVENSKYKQLDNRPRPPGPPSQIDNEAGEAKQPPSDCVLCLQPLPEDLLDCTVWEGKTVHLPCYRRMKDKEAQPC